MNRLIEVTRVKSLGATQIVTQANGLSAKRADRQKETKHKSEGAAHRRNGSARGGERGRRGGGKSREGVSSSCGSQLLSVRSQRDPLSRALTNPTPREGGGRHAEGVGGGWGSRRWLQAFLLSGRP